MEVRKVHQRQSLNIRTFTCLSAGFEERLTYQDQSSECFFFFFLVFRHKIDAFDYIFSLRSGV